MVLDGGEGWLGFLDLWSGLKPWWIDIYPCGEFRWSPEGQASQIHSPHFNCSVPGIFSDILKSIEMLNGEWDAESNGKLPLLSTPSKTAAWVPEFAGKTCLWAELRPWFLSLQWRTCPWAEYYDDGVGNHRFLIPNIPLSSWTTSESLWTEFIHPVCIFFEISIHCS